MGKEIQVIHDGKTYDSIRALARELGIHVQTLYSRVRRGEFQVLRPERVTTTKSVEVVEWRWR